MQMLRFDKSGGEICVSLKRGEALIEALRKAVLAEGITFGLVSGIGALEDVTVGYYDRALKTYEKRHFSESMELVSLSGNVACEAGSRDPILHLHAVLGDRTFALFGGHLFSGMVSVVAEIFIRPYPTVVERTLDPELQLKVWSF